MCLALWIGAPPAMAAVVSCKDWNTKVFFERADATDISRCLKAGADVNARDKYRRTPLYLAARFSKTPAVVEALLKAGADVNARTEFGSTPLHFAARFSKTPAIVETLLRAGAAVNARNRDGQTPLHVAMEYSKTPAVAALLDAGADPAAIDKADKTPWDYARKNAALRGTNARRRLREERLR